MQEPTNIFTSLLIYADFVEDSLEPFITMMIFMGMIIALMLPIIAIPYIFIKLGSVAAKIQAAGNKAVRNTAMGRNALGKAARGAAGRGIERKAGQWAARGDGSLRSKAGGYKTQRDFRRSQQSAEAKRLQEEGLAKRITTDSRFQQAAGGQRAVAVARGIQEKRLKEEDENAAATLRTAGVYNPAELANIASKRTGVGVTGESIDGASSEALQRVAMRQIVSAQDSTALNKIISTDSASNKTMLYEEIQKQYSTAKGAGAHFVAFNPAETDAQGNLTAANGWSRDRIKTEALTGLSKLSFEKLVAQDSDAAKSAWAGFAEGKATPEIRQALQAAAREAVSRPEILKGAKLDVRVALEGIASGTPPPPQPTPTPPPPPNPGGGPAGGP